MGKDPHPTHHSPSAWSLSFAMYLLVGNPGFLLLAALELNLEKERETGLHHLSHIFLLPFSPILSRISCAFIVR